jgi:phage repressor protein C with HTH and peptisase S24 domain
MWFATALWHETTYILKIINKKFYATACASVCIREGSMCNQHGDVFRRLSIVLGAEKDIDMAAAVGVSGQAIYNAKKSGKVPLQWLYDVSIRLGISMDWLLFGEGPSHRKARLGQAALVVLDAEMPAKFDVRVRDMGNNERELGFCLVPKSNAELSAGGGAMTAEGINEFFAFRRDWLKRTCTGLSTCILMQVQGDSMEPTLSHGDHVLVDRGRNVLHPGGIYAVRLNDDLYIKRVDGRGAVARVISDNRQHYEPYDIPVSELHLVGQAIWVGKEL